MSPTESVAQALVAAFAARGVKRLFGVPGGGSSLDLIAAAGAQGLDFVLTRGESAAAIMAAVTGELTGAPGVVLTTLGPGLASALNGVAYAALDRAPLVLVSDALEPDEEGRVSHQALDHRALMAPLTKASVRIAGAENLDQIPALLELTLAHPRGAVHLDLSPGAAAAPAGAARRPSPSPSTALPVPDEAALEAARRRLAAARRPIVIAGLEARQGAAARALARLVEGLGAPLLTTYKAKGVAPHDHPALVGLFTGARAEARCLDGADLIVLAGLDPVELIAAPWRPQAPVVALAAAPHQGGPVRPELSLVGDLAALLEGLGGANPGSAWSGEEIARLREGLRAHLAMAAGPGISPQALVEAAIEAAPGAQVAVDAGAHMISAMALWPASAPHQVLISNGLATMGFALPAAIAAWLAAPGPPVIALTGDGGLMMCLAELSTAARLGARVVTVVFNDAALSLIDIKQRARGLDRAGVRYPAVDFAAAARGLGCRGYSVAAPGELGEAFAAALGGEGPALIDVAIDPAPYAAQLAALRG
ncbi:MAG: thiamine pyrophosphate-dependent enzyme [Alphaproteobacteria bacterium]